MRRIIHHIRHLSKRRRNRVLTLFFLVNILLLFLLYSNLFVYPNTFMGSKNISGYTAGRLKNLIAAQEKTLPTIQVKDRQYTYRYDQLGIVIDTQKTVSDAFAANRTFTFLPALFTKRIIPPPLVFTQGFDQFIADTTFDFGEKPDDITVDPETKSLIVTENAETYRFDKNSLQSLLTSRFGDYDTPIYPMLAKITNQTINQIASLNQKLAAVFGSPMMVYLNLGGTTHAVELKEEDLREAVTVTYVPESVNTGLSVDAEALNRVLTRRVHASGFPIRNSLVTQNVIADFTKAISLRLAGVDIGAVSTNPGAGPTTNGTLAPKYIEVDIAQAKMYLFKEGKVVKSFTVSTGLDYPTPTGQFEILNKVGLGYSNIYQNWLPWWMGFSYSRELNAYFGIHEQPYRIMADGKMMAASPAAIGTPSTGGCVALAPGAAREVYYFADVGTPVYIFD